MNVCILDDIEVSADAIKKIILYESKDYKEKIECYAFYNSTDFIKWLNEDNVADICFLDIKLGDDEETNGLDVAKKLKRINHRTLIIFISDYDIYYKDMVQVEPFRFLHKPFNFKEVISIFKLAYERHFLQNNDINQTYHYKSNGITYSVDLNKIEYIYSLKRKIYMKSITNDESEFYGKLDDIENEISLLSNSFLRISKSYLVNTNYVKSFNKHFVQIGDKELSIGIKYKNVITEVLSVN